MSFENLDRLVERHAREVEEGALQRGRSRFIEAATPRVPLRSHLGFLRWLALAGAVTVSLLLALRVETQSQAGVSLPAVAMPAASVRLVVPGLGPSSVELAPGAKALLSGGTVAYSNSPGPREHRIELERGKVQLEIDPRNNAVWTIAAGSIEVQVVGTIFSVLRDEASGQVRVDVERGQVLVVSTTDRSRQVFLRRGQALIAHAERLEVLDAPVGASQADPGAPAPAASATPPSARELFQKRYRERDYRGALAAAEQAGFDTSLATWDRKSVAGLADAARLAASPRHAERALLALRDRFPGSAESTDAAFLLGRVYVDALGAPARAVGWFERYLAERPRGGYAQEALGRLMVAARSTGDRNKARRVASAYLEQYPQGPYARAAASLVP